METLTPQFEIWESLTPVLPARPNAGMVEVPRLHLGRAIRETLSPESADRRCRGGGSGVIRGHLPASTPRLPATWRQSHSRWVNRPHTFDNSWLAKWELANQTCRLHAPARWAIRQNLLFGKKEGKCESVWRGVTTCLGTNDQFKPLIGESRADIVYL